MSCPFVLDVVGLRAHSFTPPGSVVNSMVFCRGCVLFYPQSMEIHSLWISRYAFWATSQNLMLDIVTPLSSQKFYLPKNVLQWNGNQTPTASWTVAIRGKQLHTTGKKYSLTEEQGWTFFMYIKFGNLLWNSRRISHLIWLIHICMVYILIAPIHSSFKRTFYCG